MLMGGGAILLILLSTNFFLPHLFGANYYSTESDDQFFEVSPAEQKIIERLKTPESLKALYMTACVAATPSWRGSLKELIERTELNAVVIDIKDYTGTISFPNSFQQKLTGKGCLVPDMKDFIEELHASSIYVIGRISVFQDLYYTHLFPELAVKSKATGGIWKDRKGISFIDVGAKPYWDYIVEISREARAAGFDELNYDYVRYPSDGDMQDAHFTWTNGTSTKAEILEGFFKYLDDKVSEIGVATSVDIFGMTTSTTHDLGIGQVLERTLPYFDYVAPMVYPSHYPKGWNGFEFPAKMPYEVIKIAMTAGREREVAFNVARGLATSTPSKLRPWLQDFNLGATYGPGEIQAQVQATYDSGLSSWMVWNAANRYTVAAFQSETGIHKAGQ